MNESTTPAKKGASFIAEGLIIHGNFSGEGDLRLSGKVQGEIQLKNGSLIVEKSGFVDGNIKVEELTIAGWVKGTIETSKRVEVAATGRVEGDVTTPEIQIAEGARLCGSFQVEKSAG
jgi:cytoskeletal protein CcmA (bactofilin family)